MDNNYCSLPERLSEQFMEIDSDVVMDLSETNPEYAALKQRMKALSRQYPFINNLLENGGEIQLSAEEHKVLNEYFCLYMRADNMEREQLYFRGHTDAFAYLKKIGVLKTE